MLVLHNFTLLRFLQNLIAGTCLVMEKIKKIMVVICLVFSWRPTSPILKLPHPSSGMLVPVIGRRKSTIVQLFRMFLCLMTRRMMGNSSRIMRRENYRIGETLSADRMSWPTSNARSTSQMNRWFLRKYFPSPIVESELEFHWSCSGNRGS